MQALAKCVQRNKLWVTMLNVRGMSTAA